MNKKSAALLSQKNRHSKKLTSRMQIASKLETSHFDTGLLLFWM